MATNKSEHQADVKRVVKESEWAYEQICDDQPLGRILNELMRRGLSRREAVVCVEQAQAEKGGYDGNHRI